MQILAGTQRVDRGKVITEGIEFGTENGDIQIVSVTGLERPPIRNNYGDWSGRDGGYMSSQLYSARQITINGFYYDEYWNCPPGSKYRSSEYSSRERLINKLTIRKLYPIFIKFSSGKIFYTEGYCIDIKADYDNYKTGNYQVTFYCPDYPLSLAGKYGDLTSIWNEDLLFTEIFGGHLVPETLPVLFEAGQHATTIFNAGPIETWPIIELTGPFSSPVILLNATTNTYIQIDTTLVKSQKLVVNMREREVTINGKSASMSINPNSNWWPLVPGDNRIYLLSSGGSNDNDRAVIKWTTDYEGA